MKHAQLTLRDLFWLVLVCALAVGWCADRFALASRLRKLEIELLLWQGRGSEAHQLWMFDKIEKYRAGTMDHGEQ